MYYPHMVRPKRLAHRTAKTAFPEFIKMLNLIGIGRHGFIGEFWIWARIPLLGTPAPQLAPSWCIENSIPCNQQPKIESKRQTNTHRRRPREQPASTGETQRSSKSIDQVTNNLSSRSGRQRRISMRCC